MSIVTINFLWYQDNEAHGISFYIFNIVIIIATTIKNWYYVICFDMQKECLNFSGEKIRWHLSFSLYSLIIHGRKELQTPTCFLLSIILQLSYDTKQLWMKIYRDINELLLEIVRHFLLSYAYNLNPWENDCKSFSYPEFYF